jgi:hypothetical protein
MSLASLKRATITAFITALVFYTLFQLSKIPTISNVSPFADDPYDIVPSIAFQIALLAALLSLARLASIRDELGMRQRARLILHGILLVELSLVATLLTDGIAIGTNLPLVFSTPLAFLFIGLGLLVALAVVQGYLLVKDWRELRPVAYQPVENPLGLTIRDCWTLVALVAGWVANPAARLKSLWQHVDNLVHKTGRAWQLKLPFIDPDYHPWRFALLVACAMGILIFLGMILGEGLPPSFSVGVKVFFVFFSIEMVAVLSGFALFGRFLGLRP